MELVYWGSAFALLAIAGGLRGAIERRHYVYLGVIAVSFFTILLLVDDTLSRHDGELWRIAVFLGSVLLTVGWMVTNEIAILTNRRHHTINMITDYISGRQHIRDREVIRESLPKREDKLTPEIVDFDDENATLTQAIDRELNFFEFAAIGLESGDLDAANDLLTAISGS